MKPLGRCRGRTMVHPFEVCIREEGSLLLLGSRKEEDASHASGTRVTA